MDDQPVLFVKVRGRVLGPFTIEQLRGRSAQLALDDGTQVSSDRRAWLPAVSMPEVGALIQRRPSHDGLVWFVLKDGVRQGPYHEDTVRSYCADGKLLSTDRVWREGLPAWVPISAVGGLYQAPPTVSRETPKIAFIRNATFAAVCIGMVGAVWLLANKDWNQRREIFDVDRQRDMQAFLQKQKKADEEFAQMMAARTRAFEEKLAHERQSFEQKLESERQVLLERRHREMAAATAAQREEMTRRFDGLDRSMQAAQDEQRRQGDERMAAEERTQAIESERLETEKRTLDAARRQERQAADDRWRNRRSIFGL